MPAISDDDEDEDEEDDVIQMPLRSYVESNEEMTESDCNVQEDDERTGTINSIHLPIFANMSIRDVDDIVSNVLLGGGSASDSGRSIASSVSTEPFFSGQNVPTDNPAAEAQGDAGTAANNSQQNVTSAVEASTSVPVTGTEAIDAAESQALNELKDLEIGSNDDNADNNDVINVYSSGDEGRFNCNGTQPQNTKTLSFIFRWCRKCG